MSSLDRKIYSFFKSGVYEGPLTVTGAMTISGGAVLATNSMLVGVAGISAALAIAADRVVGRSGSGAVDDIQISDAHIAAAAAIALTKINWLPGIVMGAVTGVALSMAPIAAAAGLKIHTHLATGAVYDYANEFKGESVKTSGFYDGLALDYKLYGSGTSILRAIRATVELGSGYSMTGTDYTTQSCLAAGVFQASVSGTINGAGVTIAGVLAAIGANSGGTLTTCKYMAALWADWASLVALGTGDSAIILATVGEGAGAQAVDYGILMEAPVGLLTLGIKITHHVTEAIKIGSLGATYAADAGVVLNASATAAVRVYAESVANFGATVMNRALMARHLVRGSTDTDFLHETYGIQGQVCATQASMNHHHAGVLGTFESYALCHIASLNNLVAGVIGRVGVSSATVIAANSVLAAVGAVSFADASLDHSASGAVFAAYALSVKVGSHAFTHGLYIRDNETDIGIQIGACATYGIYISGTTGMALRINKTANDSGTMLVHCHQTADGVEVANDFKGEFLSTATGMTGINSEWTLDANCTAALIGISSNVYLRTGHTLSAAGAMTGLSAAVLITEGTINGADVVLSGVIAGMVQSGTGALTLCKYMSALWVSSILNVAPTTGECQSILISHQGAAIDQVLFITGITWMDKFLNLDTLVTTGFVTVGATVAGTPSIKLKCKFGTTTFYLQGYDS